MLTSLENCHQNIGAFKSITKINQLTCKLQLLCPLYKHPYANSKQVEVKTSDVEEMFFFIYCQLFQLLMAKSWLAIS